MADKTTKKSIEKGIALDARSMERIRKATVAQITDMEYKHLSRLTHDFDEPYSRMVVAKGEDGDEQKELLDALKEAFEEVHRTGYNSFTNDYDYDCDIPDYFDEWDYDISCGELITERPVATTIDPTVLPPQQTLAEEGELTAWMENAVTQINNTLGAGINSASEVLNQIKAMRDGQIARLQKEIDTIKTERDKAKGEAYSFRDKYEVLTAEYEKLQGKENVKNSIDVNTIKANLKNFAENYATSDDTASTKELKQILLWFNEIMEGTAWDAVSVKTIQRELVAIFNKAKKNNQTPMVQGDYVVTKNVENEVKGVAKGATGISVNLRQNNGE